MSVEGRSVVNLEAGVLTAPSEPHNVIVAVVDLVFELADMLNADSHVVADIQRAVHLYTRCDTSIGHLVDNYSKLRLPKV